MLDCQFCVFLVQWPVPEWSLTLTEIILHSHWQYRDPVVTQHYQLQMYQAFKHKVIFHCWFHLFIVNKIGYFINMLSIWVSSYINCLFIYFYILPCYSMEVPFSLRQKNFHLLCQFYLQHTLLSVHWLYSKLPLLSRNNIYVILINGFWEYKIFFLLLSLIVLYGLTIIYLFIHYWSTS